MGKTLKLVVFSGAGMSAESGIGTFRDSGGLWEQYNIEDVATPEAKKKDPDLVTNFYNMRRKNILEASPNKAHKLISDLEELIDVRVITQNIDDLHERAGSTSVLHLHGNIRYSKSSGPDQEKEYYRVDGWKLNKEDKCPDGYRLRPHVVWFGEAVPAYDNAVDVLKTADILIVIGTSLMVYPAAGLIHYADNATKKFLIDPNSDEMQLPYDLIKINEGAESGMTRVYEEIKKVLPN